MEDTEGMTISGIFFLEDVMKRLVSFFKNYFELEGVSKTLFLVAVIVFIFVYFMLILHSIDQLCTYILYMRLMS